MGLLLQGNFLTSQTEKSSIIFSLRLRYCGDYSRSRKENVCAFAETRQSVCGDGEEIIEDVNLQKRARFDREWWW